MKILNSALIGMLAVSGSYLGTSASADACERCGRSSRIQRSTEYSRNSFRHARKQRFVSYQYARPARTVRFVRSGVIPIPAYARSYYVPSYYNTGYTDADFYSRPGLSVAFGGTGFRSGFLRGSFRDRYVAAFDRPARVVVYRRPVYTGSDIIPQYYRNVYSSGVASTFSGSDVSVAFGGTSY